MTRSIAVKMGTVLIAATLAACAGTSEKQQQMEEKNSGFLGDYSKLQADKDAQGSTIRTWISPKFTPANYNAILLEPLIFYPEPKATDQINADQLKQMIAYANEAFKREVGTRFTVVDKPQPGAARVRVAFSGVAAEGAGLAPYQYVPIALVATLVTRAATGTPQRAFILTETEARDSVSNELLGQRVKVGTGVGGKLEKIAGNEQVTLETVKPVLDEMAAAALPNLEKYVKPKAK